MTAGKDKGEAFGPRLLLGPGPSMVSEGVLRAMGRPLMGYLDPELFAILEQIQVGLRAVFGTQNEATLALPGTGMSGMECALCNLIEPGDRVLVVVNGFFGARMVEIARRCGAEVHILDVPWGEPADAAALEAALEADSDWAVVAFVHAETSTGVENPAAALARVARQHGALVVMDAVTSLGGLPVQVDAWGVDACYSATQKCVGCPPGLAPLTLSPRAWRRIELRERPPSSWYLDLRLLMDYWAPGGPRLYHHTAPVSLLYGLLEALGEISRESLPVRFERHRAVASVAFAGLVERGFFPAAAEGVRLPTLTALWVRPGIDEGVVRKRLLAEHNIEVGGGLGAWKGRVWRVGTMGESARPGAVERLFGALDTLLSARDA